MCWGSLMIGIGTGIVLTLALAELVGHLMFCHDERQYLPIRRENIR